MNIDKRRLKGAGKKIIDNKENEVLSSRILVSSLQEDSNSLSPSNKRGLEHMEKGPLMSQYNEIHKDELPFPEKLDTSNKRDIAQSDNLKKLEYFKQKDSRLLLDSVGNLRYIGESSPLSLLYDCRNVFRDVLGSSKFTDDPQRVKIVDRPCTIGTCIPIQLPRKDLTDNLIKLFDDNINQTFYVFNLNFFNKEIVDFIYENPLRAKPEKLALLYLVLALGLLFKELSFGSSLFDSLPVSSENFFNSGYSYMKDIIDDGQLWLTEAYFLIYFYYQTTSKRSTSWLTLGTAIRNAQALGLHRKSINESFKNPEYVLHRRKLWRSLYICDRISSIFLGRPLQISHNDWDEFDLTEPLETVDYETLYLAEISKVAKINGDIVQNFYMNGILGKENADSLSSDLKSWSLNLRKDLQIDLLLSLKIKMNCMDPYTILLMHLVQMYGIFLLSKPFFLYVIKLKSPPQAKTLSFYKSCIKSSVISIQLISFYLSKNPNRVELYTTINCCFMAALVIGLSIIHAETNDENCDYSTSFLMRCLIKANKILSFYGTFSDTSERFNTIVRYMMEAIDFQKLSDDTNVNKMENIYDSSEKDSYANRGDIENLTDFLQFQRSFVPSNASINQKFDNYETEEDLSVFMCNFESNDLFFEHSILSHLS